MLDAGCGPGFYIADLINRGAEVLGCDASPSMVDLASERAGEGANLRVHALENPFDWVDSQSIDMVLLCSHYINDRKVLL